MNRRLLFHGAYCSVALTVPWRLLFHVTLISTMARCQAQKKYWHRKNSGFDKISVEIKVARYHVQKKYRHHKNIVFYKISVEIKVAHYQIVGNKGGVLSSAEKISASQKYRFRHISVEIKMARYQAQKKYRHCKNSGFDKISVVCC